VTNCEDAFTMKILPHFAWDAVNGLFCRIKKRVYMYQLRKFHQNQRNQASCGLRVLVASSEGGIGNAVEATGLVHAIRILWPKCHLTFVTPYAELFENWCVVDRIIATPETIRDEVFEHTFFAYFYEKPGLWKERCSLGKMHYPKVWLMKWFLKSEREYYVDMARRCGYEGPCPANYVTIKKPLTIPPDVGLRGCIAACGRNDALWRHKRWPYYSELVELLSKKYTNMQICVVGTQDDEMPRVPRVFTNKVDLRGAYTLSETAWIMQNSDIVVGNDCGPMHIASAVNTPSVVIFGPTCIIKNAYYGKTETIYPENLQCWPCQYDIEHLDGCRTDECIKSICPEKVMQKVEIMLGRKNGVI